MLLNRIIDNLLLRRDPPQNRSSKEVFGYSSNISLGISSLKEGIGWKQLEA